MNKTAVLFASFLGGYLISGTIAMANSHSGSVQLIPGAKQSIKPSKDYIVYYENGKAYCKLPYHLFYTPAKDQFFCSISGTRQYMSVDSDGNPHCKSPYRLIWTNNRSRLFSEGRKPICAKIKTPNKKKQP